LARRSPCQAISPAPCSGGWRISARIPLEPVADGQDAAQLEAAEFLVVLDLVAASARRVDDHAHETGLGVSGFQSRE